VSELVIRSGGLVEVDTASLRAVAVDVRDIAGAVEDVTALANRALSPLTQTGGPAMMSAYFQAWPLTTVARRAADDAHGIADSLERTADLYETIELLVQQRLAEAEGDDLALARADERLRRLDDIWLRLEAGHLLDEDPDHDELAEQAALGASLVGPLGISAVGALGAMLAAAVHGVALGPVGARERLSGPTPAVDVRPVSTAAGAAPTSLADAAARVPGGGTSRVRVERYASAAGPQFVAYITGTQTFGGPDAFDMRSNIELYTGRRSASYQAVLDALEQAGAQPGDALHVFAHSQGAMVGERLALDGPYETRSVVSFGSPVQADLGDDTVRVALQHSDDPVAALQSGGHPTAVGAPGSFIAERVVDPAPGLHDLMVPAHQMSAYIETAELVDATTDPRAQSLHALFAELGEAEPLDAIEYSAERISPSTSAAG
jgi:pimeloyl-ACP methyl ester carboxylesterase